jgi:hypothetical protein
VERVRMMSKLLSWDEIEQADDLGGQVVEVPEWGGSVRIARLSLAAADALFLKGGTGVDARVRMLAACLVDESGAPLVPEDKLSEMMSKSAVVIDRLYRIAAERNGLSLKKVEDAVKNSESDPGVDSSSA